MDATPKRKRGRPRTYTDARRDMRLTVRLTAEHAAAASEKAALAGQPLAEWSARRIVEAALAPPLAE